VSALALMILHLGLQALSPHYLFTYLARNGKTGWESLAGALLAFTGVACCLFAARYTLTLHAPA
jgi:K+ potassium transporter